eukprot:1888824-Rhodomonas_salina.1
MLGGRYPSPKSPTRASASTYTPKSNIGNRNFSTLCTRNAFSCIVFPGVACENKATQELETRNEKRERRRMIAWEVGMGVRHGEAEMGGGESGRGGGGEHQQGRAGEERRGLVGA